MSPVSNYLIQVVDRHTKEVIYSWLPGLEVEKQFETELCNRVKAKGVGILRTEKHVIADVLSALRELLYDLKSKV